MPQNTGPEQASSLIEIAEHEVLDARKYSDYLLNALYTRTTKDVTGTPEYLATLEKAKELAAEVNRLQEQIEALQAIAKKHEG